MGQQARKKTTVLHLISSLEVGGIEKLLIDVLQAAARDADPGVRTVVAVVNGKYDRELRARAEAACRDVFFLNRREGSRNPWVLWRLVRLLIRYKVDLIHAHDKGSGKLALLLKKLRPGLRVVFSVHDRFVFDTYSENELVRHREGIDHNVAISRSVQDYCREKGVERTSVIYNGIDLSRYRPGTRRFREDGVLRIVEVARLTHKVKGQDILIRALGMLQRRGIRFDCDFIGGAYEYDPESLPYLQGLVAEEGLEDRVRFLGNRFDVPELLPHYDLFVLPSRTEGFGLVLLEALASGLKVIASDIEGPVELLRGGELGLLFESGNPVKLYEKMVHLVESHYDIIISNNIRSELQEFDINRMYRHYKDLYGHILCKSQ